MPRKPQPKTTHAEIGRYLTVTKLEAKLHEHRRPNSIIRVHFVADPDNGRPVTSTLQMQHTTGEVIDRWVWGEFDVQEVEAPDA